MLNTYRVVRTGSGLGTCILGALLMSFVFSCHRDKVMTLSTCIEGYVTKNGAPVTSFSIGVKEGVPVPGKTWATQGLGESRNYVLFKTQEQFFSPQPPPPEFTYDFTNETGAFVLREVPHGDITLFLLIDGELVATKTLKDLEPERTYSGIAVEVSGAG